MKYVYSTPGHMLVIFDLYMAYIHTYTHIYYCNSLLTGMANYKIQKLQHVQNMGCRIITNLWKYDHITNSMRQLHWLRIKEQILYKLGLIMYKCKNNLTPEYLKALISTNQNKRVIHSSTSGYIPLAFWKNSQVFNSAFYSTRSRLLNSLPDNITSSGSAEVFKCRLKTHLFNTSHS